MLQHKTFTKAYIGWAIPIFFGSFAFLILNPFLFIGALSISIGLFSHQKGLFIDDSNLKILSQFILIKKWKIVPIKTIESITLNTQSQMGGGLASKAGGSFTTHSYKMTFYSSQKKELNSYTISDYAKAKKMLKFLSHKKNISITNSVHIAQLKAMKTRKERESKRRV